MKNLLLSLKDSALESHNIGLIMFVASSTYLIWSRWLIQRGEKKERSGNEVISLLEERIQRDEGGRGIACICLQGELCSAAQRILDTNVKKIMIITGFPCLMDHCPPTETDGPPGALAIARAALAMGKNVVVVTDECNEEVMIAAAAGSGLQQKYGEAFSLESFPGAIEFGDNDERRLYEIGDSVDLLVAIERAGPCADGSYRTMRGKDMTHLLAPLEQIIMYREHGSMDGDVDRQIMQNSRPFSSIGIGDGGNEIGMGKVYQEILASNIPRANEIACVVPTTDLIVASVSNWGGYALAAAVAAQAHINKLTEGNAIKTSVPWSFIDDIFSPKRESSVMALLDACLPSAAVEQEVCVRMIEAGARDGMTAERALMVDGMPLQSSLDVLDDIKRIVLNNMA